MLVSISDAAKMADVSRDTLYKHIKDKGISITDAGSKRPKIDVSELIRIYGDKVKPLEEVTGKRKVANTNDVTPSLMAENAALKDKLQMTEAERDRERRQQTEQIEHLREALEKAQDAVGKVTALLSDHRGEAEKQASQDTEKAKKMADLEKLVKDLVEQQKTKKKGWWFFRR